MAAPFVVACTHCDSKLKLKDASFVGKKVRCPKCQEPFVVSAPGGEQGAARGQRPKRKQVDEDPFSGISEDDYEPPPGEEPADDFDDLPPQPVKRKSAGGRPSAKSKKKRASSGPPLGKIALIAGLVVLGLATVGGGIYGISLLLGGGASRLAWLPHDATFVAEFRVAEIWNSAALKPLTSSELGGRVIQQLQSRQQPIPTDIERLLVGGSEQGKPTVVVYFRTAVSPETLKQDAVESQYNGYTLYVNQRTTQAGFLVNPKLGVYGPEASLKAAIDQKGKGPPADRFKNLRSGGHVSFVAHKPSGGNELPAALTRVGGAGSLNLSQLESVAGTVTLAANIQGDIVLTVHDAATATQMASDMERERSTGLSNLQTQRTQLQGNPMMAAMGIDVSKLQAMLDSQEELLNGMTITASGTTVNTKVTVPGKLIQDASDAFAPMMPTLLQAMDANRGAQPLRMEGGPPAGQTGPPGVSSEANPFQPSGHGEHGQKEP